MDDVIHDILLLVLRLIDSPVSLVRAACTCKRWRRVIADAGFLRRFRSLHAPTLVAGDYFNDSKLLSSLMGLGPRLRDRPSFIPAAAASSTTEACRFTLDFLCDDADADDDCPPTWIVFDSRGSLLLLYRMGLRQTSCAGFPDIVVCDPSTQRYQRIPPPPFFKKLISCQCMGCYLVDGEVDMAGGSIGMSNFRVICMFQHYVMPQLELCTGTAMFIVFSGGGGTGSSSWSNEIPRLTMGPPTDEINQNLVNVHDLGRAGGSWYFYVHGRNLVVLDGGTGEFSHSSVLLPTLENWDHDFDLHVWSNKLYVADGRDGKPRMITVFDETMKVYAKLDGGEWTLEKSLSLPEATRSLPGYKDEFFGQPMNILTRGPGYVILSPKSLDKWLISVDLETMKVVLAEEDMGTMVYRCEIS